MTSNFQFLSGLNEPPSHLKRIQQSSLREIPGPGQIPFSQRKNRMREHFRLNLGGDYEIGRNDFGPNTHSPIPTHFKTPVSLINPKADLKYGNPEPRSTKIISTKNVYHQKYYEKMPPINSRRKFNCKDLTISDFQCFLRPFTHSKIAMFNAHSRTGYFPALIQLEGLRNFFGAIFLFENPTNSKLECLKPAERKILLKIMGKKRYSNQERLVGALEHRNQQEIQEFLKMEQSKRKEDYIKYSFRALIKFFKQSFEKEQLANLCDISLIKRKDRETLFYLFYFCESEFGQPFQQIATKYLQKASLRAEIEDKLGQFFFPDLTNLRKHAKEHRLRSKSFSKKFFTTISKSEKLVSKINETLLKMLGVMSQLGSGFDPVFLRDRKYCEAETVKNMLYIMVDNSNREIGKIFTEWDNLFKRKPPAKGQSDEERVLEIALENVDKSNFKFPWSVGEARTAFLETFLVVNERFQFSITSGIFAS